MSIVKQVLETVIDHHLFSKGETIVLGVSGGPDSLAMLYVLIELAPVLGISLHLAHLNHQLRGEESDSDAEFVGDTARKLGITATIQASAVNDFAREHHLSTEESARVLRYRFLSDVARRLGGRTVAVGHNADDQVETLIMHLIRGAGLSGLRGMTYESTIPQSGSLADTAGPPIRLVRPLLDLGRDEIEAYCREVNVSPRLDSSNTDVSLLRNRLRLQVIPYLEAINPNLNEVLRHSARILADDYEFLSDATKSAFSQVAVPESEGTPPPNLARFVFDLEKWRSLHPSMQRSTLREAVKRLRQGLRNINWKHIEDARRIALEKRVGAEATLPQGLALVVGYDDFTIGETLSFPDVPLLHGGRMEVPVEAVTDLPETRWQLRLEKLNPSPLTYLDQISWEDSRDRWEARVDADRIHGRIWLRMRRAGERFQPLGLGGRHKSLHEFMIEEKIPRHIRDLLPIISDDEKILWVCGYRIDERVKVTALTRTCLRIRFYKSDVGG